MPLRLARLASLGAIAALAACSNAAQPVTPANSAAVRAQVLPSGERVVHIGGELIRFGGNARHAAKRGWISSAAGKRALLYGSSYDGGFINIYPEAGNNQQPVGQLTSGLVSPQGLFVDKHQRLWAANTNAFNVVGFKRGATTPFATLSDPNYYPISVAVDKNGTVYAANAESTTGPPGNVTVWTKGSTNPTATLTYGNFLIVTGVGVDASNNVYVSYIPTSGPPAMVVFPAGSQTGQPLNIADANLADMTFDSDQNLVMETLSNTLGIWAPPYTSGPARTIPPFGNEPTLNRRDKKVWIAYANYSTPMIEGYDYATGNLVDTIRSGFTTTAIPYGVAVDPRSPY